MVKSWALWIFASVFLVFMTYRTSQADEQLEFTSPLTGWTLFSILIVLALFHLRKRLPFLPLSPSSNWLNIHTVGGFLAIGIFWLHIGTLWPDGLYEQILAFLFYASALSGIVGTLIQKIYPSRLTQSGFECIYERIPAEISELRKKAKDLLLACTHETGRDTLATHYLESLHWFFQRPRFFTSYLFGGHKGEFWVRQQFSTLEKFLNVQERGYLRKLFTLADTKRKIDLHYALQTVLKSWLMIHIPLATALMTVILWHMVVVHVYLL